ncbi:MAG: hypothetical protein WA160_03050 [Pseudobdellovibrio sp.]
MKFFNSIAINKLTLPFLWLTICFLLFLNGINSFISSSEYWSIYLSQHILTINSDWNAVYLKPLFHLLLSTIYIFDLNDFYHIYATKILFSINGVIQFFLIYKILSIFYKKSNYLNLFLTVFIFSSPLFLANYDRIRSDQLALTFFLLFVFIKHSTFKGKNYFLGVLFFLIPLVAFKHIYFAILALFFMPIKVYAAQLRSQKLIRKVIVYLFLANLLLWFLYFAIPALNYLLNSYENFSASIVNLKTWLRTEWVYVYLSLFPFLAKEFRLYLQQKKISHLLYIELIILLIFLIHPQKYNFFIASFLPVLYLPFIFFVHFLKEKKVISFKYVIPVLCSVSVFSLYLAKKNSHVFTLNNPQLITIERISNIITKNNLSYLDGVGILPRGKNVGCFASPDDDRSNQSCIQTIQAKIPDAIIVTNRLMSLPFDFNTLENFDYAAIGPNLFIKKTFAEKFKNALTDWPPPSLLFSSEQLY